MASGSASAETKTLTGFASNFFGFGSSSEPEPVKSAPIVMESDSNVGQATVESLGTTKTWDGFMKMSDIPASTPSQPRLSERERRRKKRMMLKKMEEWRERGHTKYQSHFTMDSPYDEIEDEYETALEEKRKKDSIKLQGWWFMTFINSVEYANAVFNPFDLNLDGWGEQISEDLESYEDIFSELHDKYKGGKLAPEVSLLLRIGFSACVVNFTNKALSSATPGFNDVIKQSPELMKMFTNATVSSMSQQSPGFNFANNLMQEQNNRPRGPPPPAPVETKQQGGVPRPGMTFTETPSNRPDLAASRGTMFQEQGVDMNSAAAYSNVPDPQQMRTARPPVQTQRPEMRGPKTTDIDNILSGLKPRQPTNNDAAAVNMALQSLAENPSLDVIDMLDQGEFNTMSQPKTQAPRRNRSNKNTISLDI
jgi:hypothetical protein